MRRQRQPWNRLWLRYGYPDSSRQQGIRQGRRAEAAETAGAAREALGACAAKAQVAATTAAGAAGNVNRNTIVTAVKDEKEPRGYMLM